jgi:hypothetical protein
LLGKRAHTKKAEKDDQLSHKLYHNRINNGLCAAAGPISRSG